MSYLKLILLWLLGTLIIYILIATSIMFSRITTLEGVKIFDFKIYVKLIEEIGTDKIDTLINVSNSLTYNSRNYYPIAVITKEKCLENGLGNSNICTNFNSISSLEKFLSNFTPIDKNGEILYIVNRDVTYIYRKLDDNLHLVGLTGKYIGEKGTFFKFILNDWANYFLKYAPGKSGVGGFKKTWQKTEESFFIIFSISIILLLIIIFIQRRNLTKFNVLKEKLNIETKRIEKLNEKYDDLNSQKLELEEKVDNKENEQKLIELNTEIEKLKKEISESSKYEDYIFEKLKKQSNNLSNDLKSEELEKIISEMQTVKHLWTREFEWKNRLTLESHITTESTNIPFTLTIAFILFENQFIERNAQKSHLYKDFGKNLESKINIVCDYFKLNNNIKNKFHEIRKARNNWFHYGRKPNPEVIEDLLTTLEQYDIKADILI